MINSKKIYEDFAKLTVEKRQLSCISNSAEELPPILAWISNPEYADCAFQLFELLPQKEQVNLITNRYTNNDNFFLILCRTQHIHVIEQFYQFSIEKNRLPDTEQAEQRSTIGEVLEFHCESPKPVTPEGASSILERKDYENFPSPSSSSSSIEDSEFLNEWMLEANDAGVCALEALSMNANGNMAEAINYLYNIIPDQFNAKYPERLSTLLYHLLENHSINSLLAFWLPLNIEAKRKFIAENPDFIFHLIEKHAPSLMKHDIQQFVNSLPDDTRKKTLSLSPKNAFKEKLISLIIKEHPPIKQRLALLFSFSSKSILHLSKIHIRAKTDVEILLIQMHGKLLILTKDMSELEQNDIFIGWRNFIENLPQSEIPHIYVQQFKRYARQYVPRSQFLVRTLDDLERYIKDTNCELKIVMENYKDFIKQRKYKINEREKKFIEILMVKPISKLLFMREIEACVATKDNFAKEELSKKFLGIIKGYDNDQFYIAVLETGINNITAMIPHLIGSATFALINRMTTLQMKMLLNQSINITCIINGKHYNVFEAVAYFHSLENFIFFMKILPVGTQMRVLSRIGSSGNPLFYDLLHRYGNQAMILLAPLNPENIQQLCSTTNKNNVMLLIKIMEALPFRDFKLFYLKNIGERGFVNKICFNIDKANEILNVLRAIESFKHDQHHEYIAFLVSIIPEKLMAGAIKEMININALKKRYEAYRLEIEGKENNIQKNSSPFLSFSEYQQTQENHCKEILCVLDRTLDTSIFIRILASLDIETRNDLLFKNTPRAHAFLHRFIRRSDSSIEKIAEILAMANPLSKLDDALNNIDLDGFNAFIRAEQRDIEEATQTYYIFLKLVIDHITFIDAKKKSGSVEPGQNIHECVMDSVIQYRRDRQAEKKNVFARARFYKPKAKTFPKAEEAYRHFIASRLRFDAYRPASVIVTRHTLCKSIFTVPPPMRRLSAPVECVRVDSMQA